MIEEDFYELKMLVHGRRGGHTTVQIISQLMDGPKNANDISKILKLDYKTVIYHLKLIEKYDYVKLKKVNGINFYAITNKLSKIETKYHFFRKY